MADNQTQGMILLGPGPGMCQQCAGEHPPEEPHNADSIYYQYRFYGQHGRWPTWKDAIAHCEETLRNKIRDLLIEKKVWQPEWDDPKSEVPEVMPAPDGSIGNLTYKTKKKGRKKHG